MWTSAVEHVCRIYTYTFIRIHTHTHTHIRTHLRRGRQIWTSAVGKRFTVFHKQLGISFEIDQEGTHRAGHGRWLWVMCMYACICIHSYILTYMHTNYKKRDALRRAWTRIVRFVCVCVCVCDTYMHAYIHICIHTYICIHTRVFLYIYILFLYIYRIYRISIYIYIYIYSK